MNESQEQECSAQEDLIIDLELLPRNDSVGSNESDILSIQSVYEIITRKRETKLMPLLIMKIIGLLYLLIEMTIKCNV